MKTSMHPESFPLPKVSDVRAERPKTQDALCEKQKLLMRKVAEQVNTSVEEYGLKPLVDSDGRVNIESFSIEKGGIYKDEYIKNDAETVYTNERSYIGSYTDAVQARYRKQYGIETEEGILEHYRAEKEKSKSNQVEMVTIALLHKILRSRFLVVRASKFDDYKNGLDYLVLDKETGVILCAFDGVVEHDSDASRSAHTKISKIHAKAEHGGAEVKYGIAVQGGRLIRSAIHHTPLFYLNIKSSDLARLTDSLFSHFDGNISAIEREIFTELIDSVKEQANVLEQVSLPTNIERKLKDIPVLLQAFEECCAVR